MSRVAFISYCHADGTDLANELYDLLTESGVNPWRDKKELNGADRWSREIDYAIAASYAMVVIATEKAMQSVSVTYEWAKAMGMGETAIKTILVYFGDSSYIPHQFRPLHWLNYRDSDFRDNLIRTLTKHRDEDGLVNVRIPPQADIELKTLAKMAFNVGNPRQQIEAAIDTLADMPDDAIAREILIEGLNKRQNAIRLKILDAMVATQFDDSRAIPKLREFMLLNKAENQKREEVKNKLRSRALQILQYMGRPTFDAIAEELDSSDLQKVMRILELFFKTDGAGSLTYFAQVLSRPEREFQECAAYLLHTHFQQYASDHPLNRQFDKQIVPVFRHILEEIDPHFTADGNYKLAHMITEVVPRVNSDACRTLMNDFKGKLPFRY